MIIIYMIQTDYNILENKSWYTFGLLNHNVGNIISVYQNMSKNCLSYVQFVLKNYHGARTYLFITMNMIQTDKSNLKNVWYADHSTSGKNNSNYRTMVKYILVISINYHWERKYFLHFNYMIQTDKNK